MEDQNVIIFLDKIKKLLELGNHPKAKDEIEILITELERNIRKKRGKIIVPLPIPDIPQISGEKQFILDTRKKQNEIIDFINKRFSV